MPTFGVALKHQMRECVLSLFWRRADLYRFFLQCQVPTASLSLVKDWEEKNLARVSIIDLLFDSLDRRSDHGTVHFEIILGELVTWQDFDSYWFIQGNLDSVMARATGTKVVRSKVGCPPSPDGDARP